jgi:hydroxypyruvate reductase
MEIARKAGDGDLVICCLSGGASALLPLPAAGITLADKQETTRLLLASGANIHEINAVRKHLSAIKGGLLAAAAYPARVLSLILSDVIGNDLDVIGSGVTAPDSSTYARAVEVLRKYDILDRVPTSVRSRLTGENSPETPKAGHPAFDRTENLIVGSSDLALTAAAQRAGRLGYDALVLSSFMEGETRDVARVHAAIAKEIRAFGRPLKAPACLVSGGETTVTLRGNGKGGRNQEFVLAAAIDIAGMDDVCILSAGTDGTDGPTDAAGAICDGSTARRAPDASAFLADNNAYPYFERLGDLVKTGPTGTNVMDVRIVLVA